MQSTAMPEPGRINRGGRPRDPSRDVAIREAVLRLLGDIGYGALTMDAVAAEAGVGKATIYRRWRTKEDLVVDTISEMTKALATPVDTGGVEGDLRILVHGFVGMINGPVGTALRELLSPMQHQPHLREAVSDGPLAVWRSSFAAVWGRAEGRDEVPPGMAGSIPAETAGALLVQRWLFTGLPVTVEYADQVLDYVVYPLLRDLRP